MTVPVEALPRGIFSTTALLLLAGAAVGLASWYTGEWSWVRVYFHYPGALFLVGCSLLAAYLSYSCWRRFMPGDLLRPAWLLILLSAVSQVISGLVSHVFTHESYLNPLFYLPGERSRAAITAALNAWPVFSPFYMAFLAAGLFYVLRACRESGILRRLHTVDLALLAVVVGYTVHYFMTVVFSESGIPRTITQLISWTSDPLLCLLLLQAVLIRRSTANMGWGLIARCWLSFTVAIFLTSVGDIGLWAASTGYLPYALEMCSWYVWFIASAAYALGPAYQLQAMVRATEEHLETGAALAR